MVCEIMEYCQFFNDKLESFPKTAEYIRQKQCLGDYESCNRFRIYKEFGGENVPPGLDPYDTEEVNKVIQRLRNKSM